LGERDDNDCYADEDAEVVDAFLGNSFFSYLIGAFWFAAPATAARTKRNATRRD
jgi:hypothetical protein